ncbi:interleukin-17 receptor A isoform X2 [Emydura macquarii macquarii]|uniref:interleukin-17 receptor A isoform X2 n=1 Tax=Emydura macquarii macquarii TaxID=1129001 RepID=UPI00352BC31E
MGRWSAALPRLVLLLLPLLVPGAPGLRLLLNSPPPFDCSQPNLNCLVRNSTCMDQSWLQVSTWTPSAPSNFGVHPDIFSDKEGKLLPVLRIEWEVATDASILYLRGVELAVLQVNNNQQICAQFDFQNNLPFQVRPNGGRWNFTFNRFEVEPGQTYQVTVHHLPKLGTSGDHNCKSMSYTVPDCRDSVMKRTVPCSLWEPSIDGKSLAVNSLLVSFSPGVESAQYRIHVTSFSDEEKQCMGTTHDISESGLQHRVNVTVKIEKNLKVCCRYQVQIQPFFASCGTDCLRHSAVIPCPSAAPTATPADDPVMWLYWCITGICILLVGSVIAGAIYMTRRQVGFHHGKCSSSSMHPELMSQELPRPSLRSRKVWIVYSSDHQLYVDVVLKFAQFLIRVCGTEVVLDLLETRQISEIGALPWLTRQKKEMEELSSKIIVLCSRGTRAKWQAMLGKEGTTVCLKQDQLQPTGDMFTPALNLILPDFKKPACFGMYIVCYFEGISEDKDIPDPFNVTSKYQLMDRFEDIYFLIQDMEKFEPGRIHQIQEITAENYAENSSGWKLKEAIQKFQKWQAEHPDWFERENKCSEDEDLQSLDREISEELMLAEGVIMKQQLHVKEPESNDCCAIILHMNEDEGASFKLQPQLNLQGDPTVQTLMIPADEAPPVHMVEPISLPESKNATSHQVLTNTDWMERIPLLETSVPMRNSIILCDDFDVPSSDERSANHLPDELRQQLEGLMYSLYQQSVIPSELALCQEDAEEQQQVVFNNPCKDQRQSVQSDQGYISRCSPLPPDYPVEEEEEEEEEEDQEQENKMPPQYLSPEVLDSLKSLQQKLLFQEIHQKSSWEHMGGMMDTGHSAEDS